MQIQILLLPMGLILRTALHPRGKWVGYRARLHGEMALTYEKPQPVQQNYCWWKRSGIYRWHQNEDWSSLQVANREGRLSDAVRRRQVVVISPLLSRQVEGICPQAPGLASRTTLLWEKSEPKPGTPEHGTVLQTHEICKLWQGVFIEVSQHGRIVKESPLYFQ